MKRYAVSLLIGDPDIMAFVYIEAHKLKQCGHETIIADGVRIDLPGEILKIEERLQKPPKV